MNFDKQLERSEAFLRLYSRKSQSEVEAFHDQLVDTGIIWENSQKPAGQLDPLLSTAIEALDFDSLNQPMACWAYSLLFQLFSKVGLKDTYPQGELANRIRGFIAFSKVRGRHEEINRAGVPRKILNGLMKLKGSFAGLAEQPRGERRQKSASRIRAESGILSSTSTKFSLRPKSIKRENNLPPLAAKQKLQLQPNRILLPSIPKESKPSGEDSPQVQLAIAVMSALKHCCQYQQLRVILVLEPSLSMLLDCYKSLGKTDAHPQMLKMLSASLRHLLVDAEVASCYQRLNVAGVLGGDLGRLSSQKQTSLNILRILAKLCESEQCSRQLFSITGITNVLAGFLRSFRSDIYFVTRVTAIFAHASTFDEEVRRGAYASEGAFADIVTCLEHYALSEAQSGKPDSSRLGISMTSWDFKALSKQTVVQALAKLLRLIANIVTVADIGRDVIQNQAQLFRKALRSVKLVLSRRRDIAGSKELVLCGLSCLANLLFYEREAQVEPELKLEVVQLLSEYVMQTVDEQITCQGLRVLANLSREREMAAHIFKAKISEAALILLDSSSKQIVYFSLGVLMNLASATSDKQFLGAAADSAVQLLQECGAEDLEVVGVALKLLTVVSEADGQLLQKHSKLLPELLHRYAQQCDFALGMRIRRASKSAAEVSECRECIRQFLERVPESEHRCEAAGCGRKFASREELARHRQRRHS